MKIKAQIFFALLLSAICFVSIALNGSTFKQPTAGLNPNIVTSLEYVLGLKLIYALSEPILFFVGHLLLLVPGFKFLLYLIFPCYIFLVGFVIGKIISLLSKKQLIITSLLYLCFISYQFYYYQKIHYPQSSTDCLAITSEPDRQVCLMSLAFSMKDPNICLLESSIDSKRIFPDPSLMINCFLTLKKSMNGSDFCNKINDSTAKEICNSI